MSGRTTRSLFVAAALAVLVPLAGCPFGFGEPCSVLSAGQKLAAQNIGDLNACEWQVVFANLPAIAPYVGMDLTGIEIPALTDAQAQAIVDFLRDHGVRTFDDLFALDFMTVVIPEELLALLAAFM